MQAVEELKEKEAILEKKMLTEVERAKEFAKENNRRAAMQCLRKKKLYSGHIERVQSFRMRLHSQEKIQRNISNRYNRDMHKVLSKKQFSETAI